MDVTAHRKMAAVGATTLHKESLQKESIFDRRESAVRSYCRSLDALLTTAEGSVISDVDGRRYLDFLAGAGSLNYGHNDPDMKAALLDYIDRNGMTLGLDLHTEAKRSFLTTFEELVLRPRLLDHRVQFTGPTGTNAVEAALKIARKVTGRTNVVAFTNGFHGVSLGALAATGNRHNRMGPEIPLPGVSRMPFDAYLGDDLKSEELLARLLSDPSGGLDAPAAFLVETVQGEGGLNVASVRWLRRIAALAAEHGALLIVDDIQAGCGRTGSFFSFEGTGVVPDLVALSKSLSGYGLPMSVVLLRPEIDQWTAGEHNGTFRGNAHAFVTAEAALRKFWSDAGFMRDVARRAALVTAHLDDLVHRTGSRRKGRGMMQGVDVGSGRRAAEITRACIRDGLLIESCGPFDEVVKVMAPLTTPDEQLEQGLRILAEATLRTAAISA